MQDKSLHFDVVIVGAGMVGGAIACGLAQQNFRVALIDKALPKPVSNDEPPRIRVSALNLASEQLLRNLGAWNYIAAQRAFPYQYLAVHERHAKTGLVSKLPDISRWATTRFEAAELGRDHLGHIVENDVIQGGLLQRVNDLSQISLFTGTSLASMSGSANARALTLSSGETLTTGLVIGADGAQSQIRQLAGIGQYAEAYEQHAMVVSIRYKGAMQTGTWQSFRPEGPLAFLPLSPVAGANYGSLVWYDSADTIAALKQLTEAQLKQKIKANYPDALPEIEEIIQVASFPLVKSHAQQYWSDGVVLAGDAAHTINPLAGQGVNLGFMDAAVLIEKLGKAQLEGVSLSDPSVARDYESVRRKYNQLMMSAMDAFYLGFSSRSTPLQVIRNIGLGLANRSGPIKRKVVEYATGLQGEIPRLARVSD